MIYMLSVQVVDIEVQVFVNESKSFLRGYWLFLLIADFIVKQSFLRETRCFLIFAKIDHSSCISSIVPCFDKTRSWEKFCLSHEVSRWQCFNNSICLFTSMIGAGLVIWFVLLSINHNLTYSCLIFLLKNNSSYLYVVCLDSCRSPEFFFFSIYNTF